MYFSQTAVHIQCTWSTGNVVKDKPGMLKKVLTKRGKTALIQESNSHDLKQNQVEMMIHHWMLKTEEFEARDSRTTPRFQLHTIKTIPPLKRLLSHSRSSEDLYLNHFSSGSKISSALYFLWLIGPLHFILWTKHGFLGYPKIWAQSNGFLRVLILQDVVQKLLSQRRTQTSLARLLHCIIYSTIAP